MAELLTPFLSIEDRQPLCADDSVFLNSLAVLVGRNWTNSLDVFLKLLRGISPMLEGCKIGRGGSHIWISRQVPAANGQLHSGWHRLCAIVQRGGE